MVGVGDCLGRLAVVGAAGVSGVAGKEGEVIVAGVAEIGVVECNGAWKEWLCFLKICW